MPSADILIAFFLAAAVFAYMPGPALLYTSAQTIARGRRAGWLAVSGLHLGGYVHVIAAALGLAVVFQTVPVLYVAMKWIGAAYLVFLGLRLILQRANDAPDTDTPPTTRDPRRAFWNSVTVEVLNPKTALFFVAFLPQFTDPAAAFPIWAQMLILGMAVNILFSSADVVVVLAADRVRRTFETSARAQRWTRRAGGGILVGLGAHLALQKS